MGVIINGMITKLVVITICCVMLASFAAVFERVVQGFFYWTFKVLYQYITSFAVLFFGFYSVFKKQYYQGCVAVFFVCPGVFMLTELFFLAMYRVIRAIMG